MAAPVDLFAEAAREYCSWCEHLAGEEAAVAQAAVHHVARLYSLALALRRPADAELDLDGERPNEESFHALCRRLTALPFQYYGVVFDPMPVPAEEPVVGDVADDGSVVGLERDQLESDDEFRRHLAQVVRNG